jgi:hypothetical protein
MAAVEAGAGDQIADGPTPAEPPAIAEPSRRVWRVVDSPAVDDDCGTVGEAVRQASDGDIIEIACTEPRDDGPFTVDGKRLTIRAADGIEPILRCGESGAVPRDGSFCTVVAGTLELEDLTVRSAFLPAGGGRPSLISMRGSATMVCEGVTFVMPGETASAGVCVRSERDASDRQEIRTNDTRVEGGAAFLESKGGGRIDLFWSGGRMVTPGRFLVAEGSPRSHGNGTAIRMTLEDGLFACRDGFACLLDSPALPLAPRLQAFA